MSKHSTDKCVITGSSTHNECIKRLWRDVHRSVIVTFANTFRQLEANNELDPLNEVDIYCLHLIYVPYINRSLERFVEAWNNHALSTEHNSTPLQLFLTGLWEQEQSVSDQESTADTDTIELPSNEAVCVPRCAFKPCEDLQRTVLQRQQECTDNAKLRYRAAVDACGQHLMSNCNQCTC